MTKELVEEPEPKTDSTQSEAVKPDNKKKSSLKSKLKSLVSTKKRRILVAVVGVVVLAGMLAAVPVTRYAIAGAVIKKTATVAVVDSVTGKPVSEVSVLLAGKTVKTDSKGEAKFNAVPVGPYKLKVEKKYFQTIQQDVRVPIFAGMTNTKVSIKATGRPVLVKVINKISAAPIEKATVSVSGTTAVTDKNGEASIVLPISTKPQTAKITHDGFNEAALTVTVADKADQKADVGLTPAGKIYFLSKRTGKINVVKSNLDGTDQETVVEGTGQERDTETVLLASRDWKYLALLSKRDSNKAKLYLIDTTSGKLSTMDEGDVTFQLAGWSDHRFVYSLTRTKPNYWDDKKQALKSYNAESGQLATLDETIGGGTNQYDYAFEDLANVYILKDKILYTKDWSLAYYTASQTDKKLAILSVKTDGSSKTRIKEFSEQPAANIGARLYAPDEAYFHISTNDGKNSFYEYTDGKISGADTTVDKFYNDFYPTYLVSPTAKYTFWYESRDGKNALFVGDLAGKNSSQVATLSEYVPYGWYGDDYILMSKGGSELFISAKDKKLTSTETPLKVTDYHKPQTRFPGYGYGYGGQ
jgi:hypothetical protein